MTAEPRGTQDRGGAHPLTAYDVAHARPRGVVSTFIVTALAALFVLGVVVWVVTNERFEWDVVATYLFAPPIFRGLMMTLALTAICMVTGSVFGTILALMRLSERFALRAISSGFVWFFRSVPMLVQLIFWFNLSYLLPRITVGVPFGPEFFSWNTNDLINAFTAAVIGLTIHEAAYMAEIVRSGLLSVDTGQRDAAQSLGYTPFQAFRRVVLPQALRVILPPTGSQLISMLKGTSLVSVIGMTDLLHSAQVIYNRTFEVIPLLMVASLWYLAIIGVLSALQSVIEKRISRGFVRSTAREETSV